MISSEDMDVSGQKDTDVCINTHWDTAVFTLNTLSTKFHGPHMKVHDRDLSTYDGTVAKLLFKQKVTARDPQWPGCVFSMLRDAGSFKRLTALQFIEEHFSFLDCCTDEVKYTPDYEQIRKFLDQWQREWLAFTNCQYFKVRMPCKFYGTISETRQMHDALNVMKKCLHYKLDNDILVDLYTKKFWPDSDNDSAKSNRTAVVEMSGSESSATDSDDEEEEQDLKNFTDAGNGPDHTTRVCDMITDSLLESSVSWV